MKHLFKQLVCGGVALAPAFLLTGCITDDYSGLDNIDLTMGLGSDGLSVKLGNTDKILLEDILSVDESVKLDANNLYYLVEDGNTDFEFDINPITVNLNIPDLNTELNVLDYGKVKEQFEAFTGQTLPGNISIPIKASDDFIPAGEAKSDETTTSDFYVTDIAEEVKHINWVDFTPTEVALKLHVVQSPNVKFGIEKLSGMAITLPKTLHVVDHAEGWDYNEETHVLTQKQDMALRGQDLTICSVKVDRADLNEDVSQKHELEVHDKIHMQGDVSFHVTEDFNMGVNDFVTVKLEFGHGSQLVIDQVNGVFSPDINPDINAISISENLPDFLQDENVVVSVANPTIKFEADLQEIPVGLNLGGVLTPVKNRQNGQAVNLTSVAVSNNMFNTVYYSQGLVPYDPTVAEIPSGAGVVKQQVDDLGSLIKKLPDNIDVDLAISVQNRPYTIRMGHYNATAKYDIFVPFEFDNDLKIVYKDSTNSFKDDLEDYAAHGVRISAKAQNAIPLGLKLKLTAVGADNKAIPGITFSEVSVKPGTGDLDHPVEADLTVDGTLSDPYLLRKIDHLVFDVTADSKSTTAGYELVSKQYLRLTDVRIRLKGQVIADFN